MAFAPPLFVSAVEWLAAAHKRYRMSVQVRGLAETVRNAKTAIAKASTAAERMQASAGRVVTRVAQVEDMIVQLDAAEAELGAALGQMTNGAPPLDDGGITFAAPLTIDGSIVQVEAANKPQ
jgi:hypothetical protein